MEILELLAKVIVGIVLVPVAIYFFIKILPLLALVPGIALWIQGYPWLGALVSLVCLLVAGFLSFAVGTDEKPINVKIK